MNTRLNLDEVLDLYYLEIRCKLLEIAASYDRFQRAGGGDPSTLQECIMECERRKFTRQELLDIFHNNSCRFLGQNPKWDILPVRLADY